MSEIRESQVFSGLRVLSMAKKSLISLSLGYLMEKSSTSFSFKQYLTLSVFMIFHIASILSFLLSWQIKSCSILDTSKISPFSISLEISQLKVTCFSTAAERLLSSGSLLSASCMSSKLSNLTVLLRLALTSLMKVLMLLASSPKPLQRFFLKNQSSISDSTNSRFSFSLIGYASLRFFSSEVGRKAFCLFLMSTLLQKTPNSQCSIAEQVQGVSSGVTTSYFLSVMMRIARQSRGQSLGFFISSSSIFFATLLATSPHTSDSLTYLICGNTLNDITAEMSPSEMRLTTLLSISLQFSLRLERLMVDGILSENRLRATEQQSRQTSCMFLILSLESASASSVMMLSGISLVKQRWYSLKCGPTISSFKIFKFSLVGLMKQTALRCMSFSCTSYIFWMRQTSFLYNLDCVQMMEMMPEVSESRMSAFISVMSAKMVLKQSSAMGSRLYSSPFFFCITLSELLNNLMTHQQQQNNNQIREIRKRRSLLNIRQKERFEAIFREHLQPNFQEIKYQSLLTDGVPTVFRNYVWTQLIPNYYNITPAVYMQLAEQLRNFQQESRNNQNYYGKKQGERAMGRKEDEINPETVSEGTGKMLKWISIIRQDIPRTFPKLLIFHSDQEQAQKLANILGCFALFRSDVGYIQGMSLIALLFLQQLNTQYRAFTALTTLITTTALYDYYTFNNEATSKIAQSIMDKVKDRDEEMHESLVEIHIDVKIIVIDWIMTLFSRIFQLDSILNIWDLLLAHRMQSYILEQLCVMVLLSRKPYLKQEDSSSLAKLMKSGKLSFSEQQRIMELMHEVPFAE